MSDLATHFTEKHVQMALNIVKRRSAAAAWATPPAGPGGLLPNTPEPDCWAFQAEEGWCPRPPKAGSLGGKAGSG